MKIHRNGTSCQAINSTSWIHRRWSPNRIAVCSFCVIYPQSTSELFSHRDAIIVWAGDVDCIVKSHRCDICDRNSRWISLRRSLSRRNQNSRDTSLKISRDTLTLYLETRGAEKKRQRECEDERGRKRCRAYRHLNTCDLKWCHNLMSRTRLTIKRKHTRFSMINAIISARPAFEMFILKTMHASRCDDCIEIFFWKYTMDQYDIWSPPSSIFMSHVDNEKNTEL